MREPNLPAPDDGTAPVAPAAQSADHPRPASPIVTEHHCGNLRHKGMYVMSVPDPDEFTFYDRYDATAYWCSRTQSGFGPDREAVTGHGCRHGQGRACCE